MTPREILTAAGLENEFWGLRILAADKRGYATKKDKELAEEWPTCACGRLDLRIPRDEDGAPCNSMLRYWGGDFADCFTFRFDMTRAVELLVKINRREAKVLAEMEEKR